METLNAAELDGPMGREGQKLMQALTQSLLPNSAMGQCVLHAYGVHRSGEYGYEVGQEGRGFAVLGTYQLEEGLDPGQGRMFSFSYLTCV